MVHDTLDKFEKDFLARLDVLGKDLNREINIEGEIVRAQWKVNHERM